AVVWLQRVVVSDPQLLVHFWRDNDTGRWSSWAMEADGVPITGVTGTPSLIQGTYGSKGNFEMLVPQGDELVHYWRDNDDPPYPWHREATVIGTGSGLTPLGVSLIQSSFGNPVKPGNLEAVVRAPRAAASKPPFLMHYWRDNDTGKWSSGWAMEADGVPITGVTAFD